MDEETTENETPENNEEETSEESTPDELVKSKEYGENQKIRAEKAEKELKKLKADKPDPETSKNTAQPDEPNYALDAFLEGRDVKHPDDSKLVKDEMNRLKLPASDILGMKHIKAQLKDSKDQREAEGGMPEGGKGKSKGNKGSVDYWINRKNKDGTYDTPTDTKLANEIIDARVKTKKEGNMFSEDLY